MEVDTLGENTFGKIGEKLKKPRNEQDQNQIGKVIMDRVIY